MRKASHAARLSFMRSLQPPSRFLILIAGSHSALAQMGPFGGLRPPAVGGIGGWLIAKQAIFYRALAGLIRSAKTDGSAVWGLLGISFAYGIFHAAGPGPRQGGDLVLPICQRGDLAPRYHAVFCSRRYAALTAVAIVGVAAVLLGATAKLMGDTVRVIEIVSYGLIALLGARLMWVKGRGFLKAIRALRNEDKTAACIRQHDHLHSHHKDDERCHHRDHGHTEGRHHDHGHEHLHDEEPDVLPCGHAHGPEPDELAGPGGWYRGISAVISVGLRPCSGAIIVLVFALAQGMFWAGIASTFVMGIGTAITVGTIATLAIGAKALAKRFASERVGYGSVLVRAVAAILPLLQNQRLATSLPRSSFDIRTSNSPGSDLPGNLVGSLIGRGTSQTCARTFDSKTPPQPLPLAPWTPAPSDSDFPKTPVPPGQVRPYCRPGLRQYTWRSDSVYAGAAYCFARNADRPNTDDTRGFLRLECAVARSPLFVTHHPVEPPAEYARVVGCSHAKHAGMGISLHTLVARCGMDITDDAIETLADNTVGGRYGANRTARREGDRAFGTNGVNSVRVRWKNFIVLGICRGEPSNALFDPRRACAVQPRSKVGIGNIAVNDFCFG